MSRTTFKRLIYQLSHNVSYVLCAIAAMLAISSAMFYIKLRPKHISQYTIKYALYKPQCRDTRFDNDSTHFKPLCRHLRFDIPTEQFFENAYFNMPDVKAERIDWHDYAAMFQDSKRIGPGEQGKATVNKNETSRELEAKIYNENNFNGYLSDIISVNRSVPDIRLKECLTKRYLAKLPAVSIVIACRNEYKSVLKRTLHSIINRTPKELLNEIIIVDDYSTRGCSLNEMMNYTDSHFRHLVKFIRLPKRMGLMYVRAAGAKIATSDVLVFFDSHIECNYNWLPPLLEPIAINDRICTTPYIDRIDEPTLRYEAAEVPFRGGPSWELFYAMLLFDTSQPNNDITKPYKDAVMMGGLFAISRKFFWKLGGYDVNLDTYGSEQFELSFKIWMCGGMLLSVPCSHVGHIFVVPFDNKQSPKDSLFTERNKKRVAEVWMDEYKHYLYITKPEIFYKIDAGDLTEQHAVRKRLKCKSYEWYLNFVAPDFKPEHPLDLPPDFANGTIQSVAFPNFCLDGLGDDKFTGVYECSSNRKYPHLNQRWHFNYYQEVKNFYRDGCLDVYQSPPNATVYKFHCHREAGNQFWFYDKNKKFLIHRENGTNCLEVTKNKNSAPVILNECDENNERMKWDFGFVNELLTPQKFIKRF